MTFQEYIQRMLKEYENIDGVEVPSDEQLLLQFMSLKVFSNWNIEESKRMSRRLYKHQLKG